MKNASYVTAVKTEILINRYRAGELNHHMGMHAFMRLYREEQQQRNQVGSVPESIPCKSSGGVCAGWSRRETDLQTLGGLAEALCYSCRRPFLKAQHYWPAQISMLWKIHGTKG